MDVKVELIPLSVADVDRSVAFYGERVGWSVDFDQVVSEELRFVQVTPPGSACSVCFGTGLGMLADDVQQHVQAVVADADQMRAYLVEHDVECTEVEDLPWGRFVHFRDPDQNLWSFQQLPQR